MKNPKQASGDDKLSDVAQDSDEPHYDTIDDDLTFWQTYVSEASKFDKELLENWNETLNCLLLFAALFSAINTAFIIESYKQLQPDAADVTNSLLLLLLKHRNDDADVSPKDEPWQAGADAVRVNSMLFSSLACSLLASFGAILGKEMLAEYKSAGALSIPPEQGRRRQRRFHELRRFRFKLLMQLLPALLQLSLALFLVGIIDFLWRVNFTVTIVIMVPVVVGFAMYCMSLVIALRCSDSPFQTSVSKTIKLFFPPSKAFIQFLVATWRRLHARSEPVAQATGELPTQSQTSALYMDESRAQPITQRTSDSSLSQLIWGMRNMGITFYIAGVGIGGWFTSGWSWLGRVKEDKMRHFGVIPNDVVSVDCVVWLLEKAENREVVRKALETAPLLPPQALLQKFRKNKKVLERYVLMYNSGIYRRAGDFEFRLEEGRVRDATLAGAALFHALKARQEQDETDLADLRFGDHADIQDWIGEPEQEAKIDFKFLTVVHCIQLQMGVELWDVGLHLRLLQRLLAMIRHDFAAATHSDQHGPIGISRLAHSVTYLLSLLLDAMIYCASQSCSSNKGRSVLELYPEEFDEILSTLYSVLVELHPVSMALTSHVALAVAAVQWYRHKGATSSVRGSINIEFNGVTLTTLRARWLTTDKQVNFFENINLALKLVGPEDSPAIITLYSFLLLRIEDFTPRGMDVSYKLKDWNVWWTFVCNIPGMLCLLRSCKRTGRIDTSRSVIRILAWAFFNDWDLSFARDRLAGMAEFQVISPIHPDYGQDMISLIISVLSVPSNACPQTRRASAKVLGWMMISPGIESMILSLVDDPHGMYGQVISIPSFLMSVLLDPVVPSDATLKGYCEYHFKLLIRMEALAGSFSYKVQQEALVIALANLATFQTITSEESVVSCVRTVLNRMTCNPDTVFWPSSFVQAGIAHRVSLGEASSRKNILMLTDDIQKLGDPSDHQLWCGTALIMLWKRSLLPQGSDPSDFWYLPREDVILMLLKCFDLAVKNNCEISLNVMDDCLAKVLEYGRMAEELKGRVESTKDHLKFGKNHGWKALVLRDSTIPRNLDGHFYRNNSERNAAE